MVTKLLDLLRGVARGTGTRLATLGRPTGRDRPRSGGAGTPHTPEPTTTRAAADDDEPPGERELDEPGDHDGSGFAYRSSGASLRPRPRGRPMVHPPQDGQTVAHGGARRLPRAALLALERVEKRARARIPGRSLRGAAPASSAARLSGARWRTSPAGGVPAGWTATARALRVRLSLIHGRPRCGRSCPGSGPAGSRAESIAHRLAQTWTNRARRARGHPAQHPHGGQIGDRRTGLTGGVRWP